jgi:hypothetical protein
VLEGLELVQLEGAADTASGASSSEHPPMKALAVQSQQLQSPGDGAARAVENARGLAVGDLGGEQTHQLEMQPGIL